jgi:hypothetical protein
MLAGIGDSYASKFCMSFNYSKSKFLAIFPANRRYLQAPFREFPFCVGNNPIEFVESSSHLGHLHDHARVNWTMVLISAEGAVILSAE